MTSTPEMRFLTRCLPLAAGTGRDLAAPEAPLDWSRLVDLGRWHGMAPLLAFRLLSGTPSDESISPAALSTLKDQREEFLYRSLIQISTLVELQREFDQAGLTILPWKGPSVGLLLYGSAALRDSGDLDFLFLEDDLPRVQEIVFRLGYVGQRLEDAKSRYEFDHQHEYSFFRSRDNVLLEFHAQILTSRFSAWQDSQAYLSRADVRYPLAGTELLLQTPEDLLVSLCVHAAKHNWERMKWSCDIAMFLHGYGTKLDWQTYLSRLGRQGKHSVVLLGLALARDLFSLELPQPVSAALTRLPAVNRLAGQLCSHLLSGSMEHIPPRQASEIITLLCPRLWDRLVYVLSPIFRLEYEDLYIRSDNRLLSLWNYPYRFWRLLRRHGLQRLLSMTAVYIRSVR